MASTSRVGTGLLGTFGLALAGLMAYTLAYEGCAGPRSPGSGHSVVAELAVFFPDRRDWSHFRGAVEACTRRGLCHRIAETDDAVVVETPGRGRRIRFGWHGTRGIREIRDEVERIANSESGPIGVIGSSTTVLTIALAEALRDQGSAGPVLMVPWATAIQAGGSAPLLAIDRGRTFRFCPNNRRLAESVVHCLIQQEGGTLPGRVYLVVDPHDPYSVDLADCFRKAILGEVPSAEIVERADAVGLPGVARPVRAVPTPSVAEAALADEIWTAAEAPAKDRSTWVVLPLQGDPTRRMLSALQSRATWQAPADGERPLHVLTGDAIGRETLEALGTPRSFPIWCASASSICPAGLGVTDDTHTMAEIVSAVLLAVDRSPGPEPTADDLRDALSKLDLAASHPSAFGRPLRFGPDGERKDDPGLVLATLPGMAGVIEFGLDRNGRWTRAHVALTESVEARP
jgi:hypothetical protein